jgi:hypothetical protein
LLPNRAADCRRQVKKQQQKIELWLEGRGIQFEKIDICMYVICDMPLFSRIAVVEGAKEEMRAKSGIATLAAPQLFNGDAYLGVCSFNCVIVRSS